MSISQYINEINKASRHGKLVFFVGAGLSSLSGYPRWAELVDVFYKRLYGKDREGVLTSDDYLRIPQIFYDVLEENKKNKYDEILREVFDVEKIPNSIHYKILSLNPAHIITTNYDDLLEKTCWQRGKYYTKISAEKDVSGATSSRYLVKVHGDFSRGFNADNVVLKESDYMSYDQNYPLISNLMKTIMATHTIVFIGYGLGDYNINLLLNWVKQLQKDGYNKPFFIRTDQEPIKESDAKYFKNKGLRIIDSASLKKSEGDEYLERYNAVMDVLVDYRNNTVRMEDSEIIELFYQQVQPLFTLKSIRKTELKYVFDNDYFFNVDGLITSNSSTGEGYLERFYSIQIKSNEEIDENTCEKYNAILEFFSKNNIFGMANKTESKSISIINKVTNPIFDANFDEVEQSIDSENDDVEFLYKKAFYLASMGKLEEAYSLYTKIISITIKSENLWVYFLSQINRYHLYQSIKQTKRYLDTIGILTYGRHYQPFSKQFIEQIESELKNFNLNDLFLSMPNEFQEDYKILEFLSDNKFLYDDTVKLFELTNKVKDSMSKGSVTFGLTSENEIMLRVYETIRFLFDNHLLSISFGEFKKYVKNAIILQFEKAEYDLTRDTDRFGFLEVINRSGFYIDYFDFVIISKTFNIDDIKYIERACDISRIVFKEEDKIEEYLSRLILKLEAHYTGDSLQMNILFYSSFINEIKLAVYFAKYVSLSPQCITKLIKAILYLIPLRELDNGKKYLWCERLTKNNSLPEDAVQLIENFLLKEAQNRKDSNYSEMTSNNLFSHNFSLLIHHYYPKYISERLSKYAVNINKSSGNEIDYVYKLSRILTAESKKYLFENKTIKNIKDVIDGINAGDINSIAEYDELVVDYVSDRISEINSNKEKGVTVLKTGDYLVEFASQFFMGELKNEELNEYKGVVDEYDMFIDPNCFDYSKFDPVWLKRYSDELLMKISENKHMRNNILKILKERIVYSKDHMYLSILLKHFV
ncbi:SIR2 family protein [Alkaliphilus hydrothermalis]|uniref:SIR2-like domain-containing protein n=1 Tax=Alkaliphilus hydrothermalis TaxID=1482730 RepID=A0ABS2NML4_9FIRM|nr:SIR2 family protein [Alkaliphilus hydrothermalis]MBM7614170.1 hypothetical protein [Alkaliphilus hydrothermalis]